MYKDTVTIFNRYQDANRRVMWYPTVLHRVNLNMDKAAIIAKYGPQSADNAVLNVKYRIVDGNKTIGDKVWLPPKEWIELGDTKVSEALTFTSGNKFDFFWAGKWDGNDPICDADYGGNFYQYMNEKYDYVFAINSVGGPYTVIPHFEIMGR